MQQVVKIDAGFGLETSPVPETWIETFLDPARPDFKLELVLRKINTLTVTKAQDVRDRMFRYYVAGTGEPGTPQYVAPAIIPAVGNQPVQLDESSAMILAVYMLAQSGPPQTRYSFEELARHATCNAVWLEMVQKVGKIMEGASAVDVQNPLAPPTSDSSESPSAPTD